ncbi:MAG: MBL fold metallo-hydrolase [Clostridiales bacterium]|nr:MBL fold metallo-hydrolase [Clostridiales bacterium]
MKIKWIAHSCFHITLSNGKVLLFDPFAEGIGYQMPRMAADCVFCSHDHFDHNGTESIEPGFALFHAPGHYETEDLSIEGIPCWHDDAQGAKRGSNIIFKVKAEGVTLVHLGDLGHLPSPELAAQLSDVDVLMIPVGGNYTIDAEQAFEICKQLEPNVILPMHYRTPSLSVDVAPVAGFIQATKGYFDRSVLGESSFSYTAADRKKRTRIFLMNPALEE